MEYKSSMDKLHFRMVIHVETRHRFWSVLNNSINSTFKFKNVEVCWQLHHWVANIDTLIFKNLSIVDLQRYVSVPCTEKFVIYITEKKLKKNIYMEKNLKKNIFQILFYYGLLQVTEYGSLCSTVGPCLCFI